MSDMSYEEKIAKLRAAMADKFNVIISEAKKAYNANSAKTTAIRNGVIAFISVLHIAYMSVNSKYGITSEDAESMLNSFIADNDGMPFILKEVNQYRTSDKVAIDGTYVPLELIAFCLPKIAHEYEKLTSKDTAISYPAYKSMRNACAKARKLELADKRIAYILHEGEETETEIVETAKAIKEKMGLAYKLFPLLKQAEKLDLDFTTAKKVSDWLKEYDSLDGYIDYRQEGFKYED